MGHHGGPCPESPGDHFHPSHFPKFKEQEMVFVDIAGVRSYTVSWCNCSTRLTKVDQILHMGLYPATLKSTRTVLLIWSIGLLLHGQHGVPHLCFQFLLQASTFDQQCGTKVGPGRTNLFYCLRIFLFKT